MERMYHARSGTRIINLEELIDGEYYVVGDKSKFVKMDYPIPEDIKIIRIKFVQARGEKGQGVLLFSRLLFRSFVVVSCVTCAG